MGDFSERSDLKLCVRHGNSFQRNSRYSELTPYTDIKQAGSDVNDPGAV